MIGAPIRHFGPDSPSETRVFVIFFIIVAIFLSQKGPVVAKRVPPDDHSRTGSLWQSAISLKSLDRAWEKVRGNGGCAGGDGVSIPAFQPGAARQIAALSTRLAAGKYHAAPYRIVAIPKKHGGARRLVIPSLSDRIVQTALAQALGPVLEPQFEESSFAYRPGRSVKQAVQAIERWRDAGFWYVVEADIVDFFDNIRHGRLLDKLERALAGWGGAQEIVDHIALMLEHQAAQTGIADRGVAQGSPLSPLLANLYLDAVDEAMEGKGVRLVRFADDFVVLCKRQKDSARALAVAVEALGAEGLDLHSDKTRIIDFDRGFEFLGHLFVRSFALQQVSDPRDDALSLLRGIAEDDRARAQQDELVEAQAEAGYDRGARVLYVTEPRRRLGLHNLSFAVRSDAGRDMAVISHERVDRIEVGPAVEVDAAIYDHCLATGTELALVNGYGETQGLLVRPETGMAELQLAQASAAANDALRATYARALVDARIRNQRTQLFRLNRKPQDPDVIAALARMKRHLRKLDGCAQVAQMTGLEGAVGAEYWPALGRLTTGTEQSFRRRRPADDAMNATLNYLAAILTRDMRAAVVASGLHPGFGLLHATRDRADALVYDLVEPFRAPLAEGLAAYLFNARRLRPEMFHPLPEGGMRIGREARGAIIRGYEHAAAKRVNVTGRSYKLAWRPLMRRQTQDLAKALRAGDPALFRPYLMEP